MVKGILNGVFSIQEAFIVDREIACWDWPDEKIRKYYHNFYIDIDEFIEKHKVS